MRPIPLWALDAWFAFGRLPALPVLAAFFALAAIGGLLLDTPVAETVLVAVLAAYVLYCLARPTGGWDAFAAASLPGCVSWLVNELFGVPRWLGVVLIPLALWLAWNLDRDAQASPGSPRTAAPG
jgi:hypothetical protein